MRRSESLSKLNPNERQQKPTVTKGGLQRMQKQFNIRKCINVIYHINRLK